MLSMLLTVVASSFALQTSALQEPATAALRVLPAPPSAPMKTDAKRVFFRFYDKNQDGFVTAGEVNHTRARREGAPLPGPTYVATRDRNGDGRLDWEEFAAADFV